MTDVVVSVPMIPSEMQPQPPPSVEEIGPVEDTEKDENESDIIEDDDENQYVGGIGSRTVTLQMLLAAKILTPGKSTMSIEYLGQKFVGDLLPDGKIKSQETETIFCSPSAWAMYCKRIINPDKKSGCGWASVKYKGKKLDTYKAIWVRKCQQQKDGSDEENGGGMGYGGGLENSEKKESSPPPPIKRAVVPHNTISNRNLPHDANTLIEAIPFSSMGKMQPFLITISKSAIFLMDFHCHLTKSEVCGYLGGTWDINAHNLIITHAFPCRNTRRDRDRAGTVERDIQKVMTKMNLLLVGWYHSHPKSPSQPTLRDCDAQMEYQIKMKGPSDASYTPCVGFICSPYNEDNPSLESTIMAYWILPPPENKPQEYGRPMLMSFTITPDTASSTDYLKSEIHNMFEYYKRIDKMLIHFGDNYRADSTYIEKMKNSLYMKFPKQEDDCNFWNIIREIVDLEPEEVFEKPASAIDDQPKIVETVDLDARSDDGDDLSRSRNDKSQPSLSSITSLQQQLSLPSGLNMNPTPLAPSLSITPNVTATPVAGPAINNNIHLNNFSTNSTTSSSPRDSPITISSNAASPGKFEIPVRASPSPAKSDTSSTRTRNSPAPSPGKFPDTSSSRNNSPSVAMPNSSNLYDISAMGGGSSAMTNESMNDFLTASLASLAGKLPPGMQPSELAMLFQQKLAEYGVTGFNPAAVVAALQPPAPPPPAPVVTKATPTPPPPAPIASTAPSASSSSSTSTGAKHGSYKDLYKDLEKYDINYLLQQQYNLGGGLTMSKASTKSKPSSSSSSSSRGENDSQAARSAALKRTYETLSALPITPNLTNISAKTMQQLLELEESKADLNKLSDFMKSPEYASLLLQHAAGYGGLNYGLGSEISISKKPSKKSSAAASSSASSYQQASDLTALLQNSSKLADYVSSSKGKSLDYSSLLEQHKLPDLTSITPIPATQADFNAMAAAGIPDMSALFGSQMMRGSGGGKKSDSLAAQNEMLNSLLFQSVGKSNDLNSLLLAQSMAGAGKLGGADLSAYFPSPSQSSASSAATKSAESTATTMLPHISPSKMQDISALFQHAKYPGIPDPLAKSTLAANNMYMTPTASLLKMQQEAINAMMMKPPKATTPLSSMSSSSGGSSSTPAARNTETPPAERPSSKSSANRDSPQLPPPSLGGLPMSATNLKYNFSAADLAISASPSLCAADFSPSSSSSRRSVPPSTPPVDMSGLGGGGGRPSSRSSNTTPTPPQPPPKKRMEFSSIADLAAPPPNKIAKDDHDDGGALNLSNS